VNVGLMQLDTRGKGAGYTMTELKDPATNLQIAYKGSSGGADWSAWSTWPGAASTHLGAAQAAAAQENAGGPGWLSSVLGGLGAGLLPGGGGAGAAGLTGQLLQLPAEVTNFLSALETPLHALMWLINPANWARIIAGVAGTVLAGLGIYALAKAA
jgi:hypothetical protein